MLLLCCCVVVIVAAVVVFSSSSSSSSSSPSSLPVMLDRPSSDNDVRKQKVELPVRKMSYLHLLSTPIVYTYSEYLEGKSRNIVGYDEQGKNARLFFDFLCFFLEK